MRKCLPTLLLSLALAGCAKDDIPDLFEFLPAVGPFAEKNTSGIKTPSERMEDLRAQAALGKSRTADERAQFASQWAQALPNETDPLVRCEVVKALGANACPMAAQSLRQAMQDPDAEVRIACCDAWGAYGGVEAVQVLSGLVESDENLDVRMAAVKALGTTGESSAVQALQPALESDDPAIQITAVESMRSVSGRNFGNDVNAWREYASGREPQVESPSLTAQLWGWWK
ncbi:MAG: HEAT repeat domain-containing protein [Planctomycetia bacterium]|nr:HEAT repeat domain-containing protein [Planctomycetia bacterium]